MWVRLLPVLFITTAGSISSFGQTPLLDSLYRVLTLQKGDTLELTTRLNLANEYLRRDLPKARQVALDLIKLTDEDQKAKWRCAGFCYLVTINLQTGQPDSARYFLSKAAQLVEQHPDNTWIQHNYNQAAGFFYKETGELKKALPYMLANIALWKKPDENRAGQFLNVGNLYFRMGDYQRAADSHLQALALFETLQNKRGQSFCLQGLGNDFLKLAQYEQAKTYFEKSLALKQTMNDKRGLVTAHMGLGEVYDGRKEYINSMASFKAALAGAREMKLIREEISILIHLGLLHKHQGDLTTATSYLNEALAHAQKTNDRDLLARVNSEQVGLRLAERQQKSVQADERLLKENLDTYLRTGDLAGQAISYAQLSAFYAQSKQFEKAFHFLNQHHRLEDSLQGERVIMQIQDLEKKYQADKRDQEIALLKKDQQLTTLALERQRINYLLAIIVGLAAVIIAALLVNRYRVMNRIKRQLEIEKMRQSIARDLHDDMGSALSSINIMSQLALHEPAKAQKHIQNIHQQASQMMETISDIVWSINPTNDTAEQTAIKIREFAAELLESKNIACSVRWPETMAQVTLDTAKRKNLFLIAKEAINNAAKYSGARHMNILFDGTEGLMKMTLSDDGKGFDIAHVRQGNGLRNMEARAREMGGAFRLSSSPQSGSAIEITVPIT